MRQEHKPWIFVCLCFTIVLGIAYFFVLPLLGMLMIVTSLLMSCIVYIQWTREQERPPVSIDHSSLSSSSSLKSFEKVTRKDPKAFQARLVNVDAKILDSKIAPIKKEIQTISKMRGEEHTTESIQKKIAELETRVESLRRQLKEDEFFEREDFIEPEAETTAEDASTEEEVLLELVIRQLLDSLDKKLAKRAISKHLYNRLHDKYLARLEKAKQRRSTPSKWGTKEPNTGEQ